MYNIETSDLIYDTGDAIFQPAISSQGPAAMSTLLSRVTGIIDCVLGVDAALARRHDGSAGGPCNMFSGFMIFGCGRRVR